MVELTYEVHNDTVKHVDIGFALEDSYGRKLFYANTVVSKEYICLTGHSGVIYCAIERFPLSAGEYYLSYDVYSSGQLLDMVQLAAVVSVEARDGVETWASWGGYGTLCAKYRWGHL